MTSLLERLGSPDPSLTPTDIAMLLRHLPRPLTAADMGETTHHIDPSQYTYGGSGPPQPIDPGFFQAPDVPAVNVNPSQYTYGAAQPPSHPAVMSPEEMLRHLGNVHSLFSMNFAPR